MVPFSHILVATDFGDAAGAAAELAMNVGEGAARITLMHAFVVPQSVYAEGIYWPPEDIESEARNALDGAVGRLRQRYPSVEGVLVSGDPARRILELVMEQGVDLIVMGTHGRRGFSRWLFGSVAETVIRLSPVPVMTVSGRAGDELRRRASDELLARH